MVHVDKVGSTMGTRQQIVSKMGVDRTRTSPDWLECSHLWILPALATWTVETQKWRIATLLCVAPCKHHLSYQLNKHRWVLDQCMARYLRLKYWKILLLCILKWNEDFLAARKVIILQPVKQCNQLFETFYIGNLLCFFWKKNLFWNSCNVSSLISRTSTLICKVFCLKWEWYRWLLLVLCYLSLGFKRI